MSFSRADNDSGNEGDDDIVAEINVTPLTDIFLVLLIIFMVAAPMLTVGVPIDMPETAAKPLNADTQPITVSVRPGGQVFIQETEIAADEIVAKLQAIADIPSREAVLSQLLGTILEPASMIARVIKNKFDPDGDNSPKEEEGAPAAEAAPAEAAAE